MSAGKLRPLYFLGNRISLLFLGLFLFLPACKNYREAYSTDDNAAAKDFEEAKEAYQKRQDRQARSALKEALAEDSSFVEALTMFANIQASAGKTGVAKAHFRKAIAVDPNFEPANRYKLGRLEFDAGQYEKAGKHLRSYLEMPGNDKPDKFVKKAEKLLESVKFAREAIANPVPFDPQNMGEAINSRFREYFPCITVDRQTFLFTRKIKDKKAYRGMQEDFYYSVKRRGEWQKAKNLGPPVNSRMNEGAPTLAPNGQILIFTACAIRGDYGPGRRGFGSCDLFASRKQGEGWSPPQNLGNTVNSNKWETQPSFSSDGRTLYFIQGKGRGRNKKQDIYKTMLQKDGSWSEPQKLSSTINTPGKEASVFIHPDDETLYFSSNGHPGMGGLDIYMSRKKDNGEWGEPVNLGYPINTKNDENSLLVSPDGKKAYFGTNREGGHGKLDLYSFQLPKKVRPQKVSYLKGTVTDAETGEPVGANFELIDRKTGEEIVNSWANPGNGEYVVALPPDRNYVLNASKRGYVFLSDSFELRSSGDDVEPVHKDVQMERIEPGKTVELKNVFFDTDKYELKPESRAELMKLYKFLKNNANLKIELAGHTDSVGTKEDNQVLSENRAQAVRDFLMEQGIDENRLTAKGYGETRPVATNETPEGRQKNRRTEFKILEVEGKE